MSFDILYYISSEKSCVIRIEGLRDYKKLEENYKSIELNKSERL